MDSFFPLFRPLRHQDGCQLMFVVNRKATFQTNCHSRCREGDPNVDTDAGRRLKQTLLDFLRTVTKNTAEPEHQKTTLMKTKP